MSLEEWFAFVQKGGAICAVLELGALIWLNSDRKRLLSTLETQSKDLKDLAVQVITIATELKVFLFNERKAP